MTTQGLPRELLWDDRETIEELYNNPLNKLLFRTFQEVRPKGLSGLRVLNEVWYISECIYYEQDPSSQMGEYINQVLKDITAPNALPLVMSMVHSVFALQKDALIKAHTRKVLRDIEAFFCTGSIWTAFHQLEEHCMEQGIAFNSDFRPHRTRGLSKAEREKYESRIMSVEMKNAQLEGEVQRLREKGRMQQRETNKGRTYDFAQILRHAARLPEYSEARPLLALLKDPKYGPVSEREIEQIEKVEDGFARRKYGDYVAGNKNVVEKDGMMGNFNMPEGLGLKDVMEWMKHKKLGK